MRKLILNSLIIITLILVWGILSGCETDNNEMVEEREIEINFNSTVNQRMILGYCPTMQGIAKDIETKNEFITIKRLGSTAQAFSDLNNGGVDIVLVGRLADKNELGDVSERWVREGLTLVGKTKRFIPMQELEESRVHTAVEKGEVLEYLSEKVEVVYHDSVQESINKGLEEIVLIDWEDYGEGVSLVIPMNENMQKVERFRLPVLYSYDDDLIGKIEI